MTLLELICYAVVWFMVMFMWVRVVRPGRTVKVSTLDDNAIIPTRGTSASAGYDLYALTDKTRITIAPHTTEMIRTGISVAIPYGYFGAIYARSGLARKAGLRPANCVGVIDSDYRGEIMVALHNDSEKEQVILNGDRIAQLVVEPFVRINFKKVDKLNKTERGSGGFGSTGK